MKAKGSGNSYSWWWDSHNTPKNSKWLEDNLNDMDSKVKAMLKLIEEDADSFAKRAEMYYKKRPDLVSLVEDFYRAYRALAERYDQLTGHICQIPQELQAQFGFPSDSSPGSPVSGNFGNVRRKAAGIGVFKSPRTPTRSQESYEKVNDRQDQSGTGDDDLSSSSSSDSESDSKARKKQLDEIQRLKEENERVEQRLAYLEEELKALHEAYSAESKTAALKGEVEGLKKANAALGVEVASGVQQVEKLKKELDLISQQEQSRLSIRLEESGLRERELKAKMNELEAKIQQLTEELLYSAVVRGQLEKELTALRDEKSKPSDEVSVRESRIGELEEEIRRLQEALAMSESGKDKISDLQSLEKNSSDLHIQFTTLQEEKRKLSEELVAVSQQVQSLEKQLRQAQEALESSESAKNKVDGLLIEMEKSLSDLQREFTSMQERLNGQLSLQAKEMQILEEQVERLQAALASLHGEKSRGLEFQDVLEKRLLELQQELLQAKQEANKVADEVANKAELVQRLEGEIETRDENIGSLQGEISVKQEEGSALRNQLEDSSKELQRFQNDVRKLQALLGDSQGQTKTLVQQLKEVQQELGQARAEASNLGDQLADRVSFIGRLEVEAENREKLVSNLRDEISAKLDEGHILREQLEAGAGEGKRLETGVQKLQDLLNGSQNENKELSCEMQRIFESSSKLSEESNELHRLVDTLKKELDASKQKLDHEIEILMGEKAGLTEERVQNLDDIAKLGNKLQETLIKLDEREGYILNLEQELKRLTEDLSDSHQEGASHLEKYQTLKGDKEGLDIELALLQEANSKLQSEIASRIEQAQQLELTFKKLEDVVSVMQEANAKLTSDLEMVVTQARTAEEKCLLQEQESSDLQEEKAKLAAQVGEQQASWNLDRTRLREGINQLTEEKREFQKTLLMWTEQREKLEMEHTALKSKSRDVEDSLLFHQTEHSRVLSELSEKSERVQMLDGELRKMQRELTGSQDDTRRLSTELQKTTEELKEQLKAENEKVQLLRDDVYNLQQALLSAQEERQICQEHMKEFKIKEESMESQILKLKGEVLSLNEHCKEFLRRHDDKIKQKEALEVDKQELQKALVRAQQEKESAKADCDFLVKELTRERDNRSRAEETHAKLQIEIEGLVAEIARLQAELQRLQGENENLTVRSEAALEQERKDAIEIDTLLKALQSVHEENGSFNIEERSWHLEAKHPTLRHLKESMLKLLTDRSKIKQEAVAHADRVKELNLEIEKAGQMLEVSKGEYYSLTGKHEIVLKELQTLEVQVSQLEKQILFLEEEKRKLHDQLLSSLRDSDEVSAEFLREKKELYEKLVVEGEHVLKLQEEIKMTREENIEHRSSIDDTHRQIQKLLLDIQELGRDSASKEEREKSLNQQIQTYAEEYAKVEQSLNEALSALSLEKTEVISLRDEASFKNQQLWRLEEEIALLKHKLGEREQEILVLQQHRESLEGQLETELAHIRKLEAESSLWQEKNTSLISSLSFNEKKAMELLEQHGLLTKEKEEVSAELQNKVLSADIQRQENRKLYQQVENSELRIDSLVEHSAAISQKYDAAASELENLQLQLSSLLEENGRLGNDVLSRTVSLAELTEVVSSVEKRNADLEAEANAKQENRIMMEEQMAALQQENDQLKQALKSGTEDMQVLNEEISKLRQHQLKLQNEHDFLVHEKERSLDEHSLILSRLEKEQRDLSFQQGENSRLDTEALNASTRIQELEGIISELEKEKQAFSVELASTSLLMNEMHRRADSLQDEVGQLRNQLKLGNEQLQQKNEEIQDLLSMSKDLREERIALSLEVEKKIQDYCSLEATLCSLQEEYLSLVNKNSLLSEEVASGDNLVVKLKDDIVQLRAEKEAQDQMIILRTADVQRLQEDLSLVQDSEEKLGKLLDLKEQAVHQLEEEIERLKAALYGVQEEYKQEKGNLEIELKKIQLVVLDNEERMRTLQERISSKQREIDHVQSTNENSKNSMRKLEGELESLKEQLGIFQMKNSLLNDEVSIKASLIQDLDQSFISLKEEKVVFEGGVALAIGNVGLVQAEVDKLLEKISKLGELSRATGEKLQKVEDKFCKLQVSNLNMRDELSGSAKKEKSYVIAVRFMRAEFFCLVQRIKSLEEEKADLARQAELAMDAERKKSGEVLSSLHQELAFLKEENKTLRSIIFDRAEEKREAIRQLCLTLDYMQEENRRLEGVINSVRDRIQRRISVAGARRN